MEGKYSENSPAGLLLQILFSFKIVQPTLDYSLFPERALFVCFSVSYTSPLQILPLCLIHFLTFLKLIWISQGGDTLSLIRTQQTTTITAVTALTPLQACPTPFHHCHIPENRMFGGFLFGTHTHNSTFPYARIIRNSLYIEWDVVCRMI